MRHLCSKLNEERMYLKLDKTDAQYRVEGIKEIPLLIREFIFGKPVHLHTEKEVDGLYAWQILTI
jgi:hypothetical protein